MTNAGKGLAAVAVGDLLMVAGLYGWLGDASFSLAGVGLGIAFIGASIFLLAQSRPQARAPHPVVYGLLGLAIALHAYGNLRIISVNFSYALFLWTLMPYGLVLVLGCFEGTRLAAIAGAACALVGDAWNYFGVDNSAVAEAGMAFIWIPIRNAILVVPATTLIAWLLLRIPKPA
jgi:hypothetical protein